jgi:CDP-2,3-bis-(O-geranylgeranyl)-sn-glycerol synthase
MMHDVFVALWFFLPAAAANVTPVFLAKIPLLKQFDTPIDFNRKWRGKPIFGTHKTWRGMIGGIVAATAVLWLQAVGEHRIAALDELVYSIDYANINIWLVGPLFAIGALGGDAIKSFIKRRVGIAAGRSWFPWDQIDYVIGASLATYAFVSLNFYQYVLILVIWSLSSLVSSKIGYRLGLKDVPH